jgi:hypothetical protein
LKERVKQRFIQQLFATFSKFKATLKYLSCQNKNETVMLPCIIQSILVIVSNGKRCQDNGKTNKAFRRIIEYYVEEVTGFGDL